MIWSISLIPECYWDSRGNNEANPFPSIFTSAQTQALGCFGPAAPNIQLGHMPLPSVGKPSEWADKQAWPAGNEHSCCGLSAFRVAIKVHGKKIQLAVALGDIKKGKKKKEGVTSCFLL